MKNLVHAQYIEKALEGSKSFSKKFKGDLFEQQQSRFYHNRYIPLLIDQQVLRSYGAGQVDIAYIYKNVVKIVECKFSGIIGREQWKRLQNSARLIASILEMHVQIEVVKNKDENS